MIKQIIEENDVEILSINLFKDLNYQYKKGSDISPDDLKGERDSFEKVILEERLYTSLKKINPKIPKKVIENSIKEINDLNVLGLFNTNKEFHKILTKGLLVTFLENDNEKGDQLKFIDFNNKDNNDWLVVNQLEVKGEKRLRRPDVVVFVNGLPLSVIEFKNPADVKADIWSAFNQIYKTL